MGEVVVEQPGETGLLNRYGYWKKPKTPDVKTLEVNITAGHKESLPARNFLFFQHMKGNN